MKKQVYAFGAGTADGNGSMKEVLGGKGAGLAEMSRAGVPVPPGFTVSTDVCNIYFQNKNSVPEEIEQQVAKALEQLEKRIGKKLGNAADPLLLSVRSGARFSMPGMENYNYLVQLCGRIWQVTCSGAVIDGSYRGLGTKSLLRPGFCRFA